jgi:hypothetical protein
LPLSQSYLKDTTFEDFDPNNLSQDAPLWAVYDGHKLKTFTGRGPALQAVMRAYKAKLYEFANNVWVERAVKRDRTLDNCTVCGGPANNPARTDYWAVRPEWLWQKRGGKITNPPELHFACVNCKDAVRYG